MFSTGGGNILVENSWAAVGDLAPSSAGATTSGSPAPIKAIDVDTFVLPAYLGTVSDSWHAPSGGITVIHIQDAHCNYAAQHKIADIIEYLNTEYGIDAVNLEGGKGDYDLSIFTDIKSLSTRRKVADYFVKEGLVSGAEYFAVNNPGKVELWGVENSKLYLENLKVYRESLKHKKV
ncbi:hypothetical protein ACFL3J_02985, partial [Candidatus Omnitrophota bacterium]